MHIELRSEMRAADIGRLETTILLNKNLKVCSSLGGLDGPDSKAETIAGFSELFPDQSKWLAEFGTVYGADYVAQLIEHLQYDEPIELLTMYMCIFLARGRSSKAMATILVLSVLLSLTTQPFVVVYSSACVCIEFCVS